MAERVEVGEPLCRSSPCRARKSDCSRALAPLPGRFNSSIPGGPCGRQDRLGASDGSFAPRHPGRGQRRETAACRRQAFSLAGNHARSSSASSSCSTWVSRRRRFEKPLRSWRWAIRRQIKRATRQATDLAFAKAGPGSECVHHPTSGPEMPSTRFPCSAADIKRRQLVRRERTTVVSPIGGHILLGQCLQWIEHESLAGAPAKR